MEIINKLSSLITSKMYIPLLPVPKIMVGYGTIQRPGLSPMLITSRIISRQAKFGAPTGDNIDGSPNLMNQMFYAVVSELISAMQLEGKVEITIPIGEINTLGTGGNAGGPVVINSTNIIPVSGSGIIR